MIKTTFCKIILSMILLVAILPMRLVFAAPADVTFTVDTVLDEIDKNAGDGVCLSVTSHCSLRGAIMEANHLIGSVTATIIVPSGLYTLTLPHTLLNGEETGDLNLTVPLSQDQTINIVGAGAANTIIDANQMDGVIGIASTRTARISGVTIKNGYRLTGDGSGIDNYGNLTITDSVVEENTSFDAGGGILNYGVLTVIRSTIQSNHAANNGGGMFLIGSTTIRDTTIYANSAGNGGGIYKYGGNLYLINSTINQNTANTNGGGIFARTNATSIMGLYNSSIIANDADHDHDQLGGIGGGVFVEAGTRFIVANTLIAGNSVMNSQVADDCNGTLEAYGQNLLGDKSGCTIPNALNAGLISLTTIGPLQNNGGPTWTVALLPGSVAIDSTFDNLGCVDETGAPLRTDQRGFARPVGVRCDVGAFEYSPLRYLYLPLTVR
jgi:CSLREA domain-containing protein